VVVLVEILRRNFLASLVPVIVNAILNSHHLVVDIVAFVGKGDFPRSRLGEKQRGKILAGWVTRKMRTIAQFGIRDPDGADTQIPEIAEERTGTMRSKNGSVGRRGTGLSSMSSATLGISQSSSALPPQLDTIPQSHQLDHNDFIPELPDSDLGFELSASSSSDNIQARSLNHTPTEPHHLQTQNLYHHSHGNGLSAQQQQHQQHGIDYSPIDPHGPFASDATSPSSRRSFELGDDAAPIEPNSASTGKLSTYSTDMPPPLRPSPRNSGIAEEDEEDDSDDEPQGQQQQQHRQRQESLHPGYGNVGGRRGSPLPELRYEGKPYSEAQGAHAVSYDGAGWGDEDSDGYDPYRSLGGGNQYQHSYGAYGGGGGGGGGLRVANRDSGEEDEELELPREAVMYGNMHEGPGGF